MGKDWFECAKISAYHLWEHTGCDNALHLWYAAEDIAAFFEQSNILEVQMVDGIKKLGPTSEGYIWFVRNIAYRLHIYTNNVNELDNWFLVEGLLDSGTWVESIVEMATMLNMDTGSTIKQVRSDLVRNIYANQTS